MTISQMRVGDVSEKDGEISSGENGYISINFKLDLLRTAGMGQYMISGSICFNFVITPISLRARRQSLMSKELFQGTTIFSGVVALF